MDSLKHMGFSLHLLTFVQKILLYFPMQFVGMATSNMRISELIYCCHECINKYKRVSYTESSSF